MFRDFRECSGLFRVPGFIDARRELTFHLLQGSYALPDNFFFISQKRDMTSSVTRSERYKYFNSFLKYNFRHKSARFCCFSLQIFTLYYPWVIIVSFSKQKQTKTEPEV